LKLGKRNIEEVYSLGKQMIDYYIKNPCIAAYDLLNVDLAPIQRVVFEDMWFKNYSITIISRGGGKSAAVDSLSFIKNKGLCYLYEQFPEIPSFLRSGETLEIECDSSLYTSEGFRPTKEISLEKNIAGLKLTTNYGFEHKGSYHHPLLVLDENANFCYKQLRDFKQGDRVCIQRGQNVFGNNDIPKEDAYLIGLFIGDDLIDGKYNFQSISSADDEILNFCTNYCEKHNISYMSDKDKRRQFFYSFYFKRFAWFFDKYKIKRGLSYNKEVPYSIRTANKEAQLNFLKGYFDCAGGFDGKDVSCCSVSKKLMKEIQIMLLGFGVVSKLIKKKTKSKFGKVYLLKITSCNIEIFYKNINFGLTRKQDSVHNYLKSKTLNPNIDTIPGLIDICYNLYVNYKNTNGGTFKSQGLPKLSRTINSGKNFKEYTYERLNEFVDDMYRIVELGYEFSGSDLKTLSKLKLISNTNYYFDVVKIIEEWSGDCYDFEMDMGSDDVEPNYFCNGFINHNTYLLGVLSCLSCLLYPGYRVGLIGPVFRQSFTIKSNSYDTFWTSSGLHTTAENFYDSIQEGITETQSLETQNTILSKWKNPDRACRYIKTTKGFELAGTTDHGILVLDDELDLVFKDLQDIKYNDYLVIKTGFNYFGNNNSMPRFDEFEGDWRTKDCEIPTELDSNLSYWMGLVVGGGCVSISKDKRKQYVDFVNDDQDLLDSFENYLRKYFLIDKDEKIRSGNRKNNTCQIQYFCKKLIQYLLKCGFTKTTSLDKKIPVVIKKSSRENFIAFLQGLYDTDGCVYIQSHKHGYTHCEVTFNTSSLQLVREIHSVLLNLGIVSNLCISNKECIKKLSQGNKPLKCSEAYKIIITGQTFLTRFNNIIGFRCERKNIKLTNYLNIYFTRDASLSGSIGITNELVMSANYKCKSYLDQGLYFVKMVDSKYFSAPTIDAEVENEHCYWANGFINHNSKMIFSEVEKLYSKSSLLREACEKKPTRGSDTAYLKFKSSGSVNGSFIEALPLGVDGSKIRGSRFYLICLDELAQIPDKILDLVIRPFGATTLEPMENVRRIEQQKRLIEQGLATIDDFQEETVNKLMMTSSGYYKFNHMWRRMKDYWAQMDEKCDKSPYVVHQVPYWDFPPGFLDLNNINEAKRIMSNAEFRMEYEAVMISDSEGFFKASLLDSCTDDSGFSLELKGKVGSQYIVGVDPNQGGNASCGIVVIKLGQINKIVSVLELKKNTTQDLTRHVQRLCSDYNVVRIFMDKGGGGKAVMDLLEEGYDNQEPIINITDKDSELKDGRHILEMVNFTPAWISDANFTTKALLENKTLRFPEPPVSSLDLEAVAYERVNSLKSQMLNIVVTQTARGLLHFDTPKRGQNKDLYSAIILAAQGIREFEKYMTGDDQPSMCNTGLVRVHEPGSRFASENKKSGMGFSDPMQAALLKPLKKRR